VLVLGGAMAIAIGGVCAPRAGAAPITGEFLSQLTVLASDRSTRILDSRPRIPDLLWCSLIFGGVVLIVPTSCLLLTNRRGHMILVGSYSIPSAAVDK